MLDNFFGNKETDDKTEPTEVFDENRVAGITYYVGLDGQLQVDVEMLDYTDESIDGLGKVLASLSMDNCYLQTVQLIQSLLQEEGQDEALLRIYNHLATNPNDKALRLHREKQKNKPCIKPSEML